MVEPSRPAVSRRVVLHTGAGAAALAVLNWRAPFAEAATGSPRATGAVARTVPLNQDWLFGSGYVDGSELPGFDDTSFNRVTLPHTVTELSWREWDPASWERRWIYRRHFDVPDELSGLRLFLDFDGALTGAAATLNGQMLGEHLGGYLPFSFEITGRTRPRDNVLEVVLDSRFDPEVPPGRSEPVPVVSSNVDYWQPGAAFTGRRGCVRCRRSSSPTCSRSRSMFWTPPGGRSRCSARWTQPPCRGAGRRSRSSCAMAPARSPPPRCR